MTFEEPLLEQAQKDLENLEKTCTENKKALSSFKKALGLSSSSSRPNIAVSRLFYNLRLAFLNLH